MAKTYDTETLEMLEAMRKKLDGHGKHLVQQVVKELIEKAASPEYNMSAASCKGSAELAGGIKLTFVIQLPEIVSD